MFDAIYPTHDYGTRQRELPVVAGYTSKAAKKLIRFSVPDELKSVPAVITDKISSHCLNGFSNYTKKYYLNQYDPICRIHNCYISRQT